MDSDYLHSNHPSSESNLKCSSSDHSVILDSGRANQTDIVCLRPLNSIDMSSMTTLLCMFNIRVKKSFYDGLEFLEAAKEHNTVIIPPISLHKRFCYGGPINESAAALLGENFATCEGQARGLQAETVVFQQFESCDHQIKGILLQNFTFPDVTTAYKKAVQEDYCFMTREQKKASRIIINLLKSMQGEADFIFLHPSIGICLVEVKGIESLDKQDIEQWKKIKSRINGARVQLNKLEKQIEQLYEQIICPESIEGLPTIHKIICLPFITSTSVKSISLSGCHIMGEEMLSQEGKEDFIAYFSKNTQSCTVNENEFTKFCSLLSALKMELRFESEWKEYIQKEILQICSVFQRNSVYENLKKSKLNKTEKRKQKRNQRKIVAMCLREGQEEEIMGHTKCSEQLKLSANRKISSEKFLPKKSPYFSRSHDNMDYFVWLTHEQALAVHSDRRKCVILGPPGSGKSIALMTRILKAAESKKTIWIGCPSSLVNWYWYFIESNSICSAEVFDFEYLLIRLRQISSEHSIQTNVFCDEMDLSTLNEYYPLLRERPGEADTFIVGVSPQKEKQNLKVAFEYLPDYTVFPLKHMLRNTVTIMIYVKKLMKRPHDIPLGHSKDGSAIREIECHNRKEMTQMLVQRVKTLITINGYSKRQIAIFDLHYSKVKYFKEVLIQEDIALKECQDADADDAVTFITCAEHSRSREWPAVILLLCSDLEAIPEAPLAASRAMLNLTIIKDTAFRDAVNTIVEDNKSCYPLANDWCKMLYESCYKLKGSVVDTDGYIINTGSCLKKLAELGYSSSDGVFDIVGYIRNTYEHLRNNEELIESIRKQSLMLNTFSKDFSKDFDGDNVQNSNGSRSSTSNNCLPTSDDEEIELFFSEWDTLSTLSKNCGIDQAKVLIDSDYQRMSPFEHNEIPSRLLEAMIESTASNLSEYDGVSLPYAAISSAYEGRRQSETTLSSNDEIYGISINNDVEVQSGIADMPANLMLHSTLTQNHLRLYRILQEAYKAWVDQKQKIPSDILQDIIWHRHDLTPVSLLTSRAPPLPSKVMAYENDPEIAAFQNISVRLETLAERRQNIQSEINDAHLEFGASENSRKDVVSQFQPKIKIIEREVKKYAGQLLFSIEGFYRDYGNNRTIKSLIITVNHDTKWTAKAKFSQRKKAFIWKTITSKKFDSCPSAPFDIEAKMKTTNGSIRYSTYYTYLNLLKTEPTTIKLNFERIPVKLTLNASVTWMPCTTIVSNCDEDNRTGLAGRTSMFSRLFRSKAFNRDPRREGQQTHETDHKSEYNGDDDAYYQYPRRNMDQYAEVDDHVSQRLQASKTNRNAEDDDGASYSSLFHPEQTSIS